MNLSHHIPSQIEEVEKLCQVAGGAGYAGMICAAHYGNKAKRLFRGPESKPFGRTFSLLHGPFWHLSPILISILAMKSTHHKLYHCHITEDRQQYSAHEHDLPFLLAAFQKNSYTNLCKKINESGITWLKTSLESVDLDQNTIQAGDNQTLTFDYMLACDGQKSSTRDFCEIPAHHINPFTQTSMQLISTEKPHKCRTNVCQ